MIFFFFNVPSRPQLIYLFNTLIFLAKNYTTHVETQTVQVAHFQHQGGPFPKFKIT